jgi:signal transduction histidine kinase
MDRTEALQLLSAAAPDDRLRAARSLARNCVPSDLPTMQAALSTETNRWVKSALSKAMASVQTGPQPARLSIGAEGEDDRILEQIYAEAVEETTKRLVHEIRPILGRLDVCAGSEISDYQSSRTKKEWTRLAEFLSVIDQLSQAASSPIYSEFDLAVAIDDAIALVHADAVAIECIGPKPQVIMGAGSYIKLILTNAVRNAVEATKDLPVKEPVVVSWGVTDRDYWITVLDRGRGLPATRGKIFEIGSTTKKDHLGMGLVLARQAGLSINGRITLGPRKPSGTHFEFRWPKSST